MAVALSCALSGEGCRKPSPGPIRIGHSLFPGHQLLRFAEAKGFFQKEGVAVELREFSSFRGAVQAYEAGRLDGLTVSLSGFLQLAQRIKTLKGVALLDFSEGAEGLITRKEITTIAQLRGKRVGISPWAVGDYLLARFLERSGLRREDMILTNVSSPEGQQMFLRGELDALLTFEPWLTETVRQTGANVLFTSRDLPGEIMDLLALDERLLSARREDCRRLLRAYFQAVSYVQAHTEEFTRWLAGQVQVGGEDARLMWRSIRPLDRSENERLLGVSSERAALQKNVAAHRRAGVIRDEVDISVLFDFRLIRETP